MSWVCRYLVIKCEAGASEIAGFLNEKYESEANYIVLEDNSVIIENMYMDPSLVIDELIETFNNYYFNALASNQSESSGEVYNIEYDYHGCLQKKETGILGEREIAIEDGYYCDNLRIEMKWNGQKEETEIIAKSLYSSILDRLYSVIDTDSVTKQEWDDKLNVTIKGKKNRAIYSSLTYLLSDPKTDNFLKIYNGDSLYEVVHDLRTTDVEFKISYTYIDNDDYEWFISYTSKTDKVIVEKGNKFYENASDY